jgi:hypothetical protein
MRKTAILSKSIAEKPGEFVNPTRENPHSGVRSFSESFLILFTN